jgi:hypothetical protein
MLSTPFIFNYLFYKIHIVITNINYLNFLHKICNDIVLIDGKNVHTHDFYFKISSRRITLSIFGNTSVRCLIRIPLYIFDDQSSVGEDLLLSIYWQWTVIWTKYRNKCCFCFLKSSIYLPRSQTIDSIGYPATGQVTMRFSPETIDFFSIGRT